MYIFDWNDYWNILAEVFRILFFVNCLIFIHIFTTTYMIDWVVYRKFNCKSLLLNITLCLKVKKYWKLWIDDSIQQMLYISRVVIMSMSNDILFPFLRKFHIHNWNTRGIYPDTLNWQGYSPLIIYLFTY